jgi:D-beta-D-heptose 7-phosphate kinase/D-beta-D-heptose 1-phosphate adenosyltransferase
MAELTYFIRLAHVAERFSGKLVLVLGDVMLDRYWWGTVERISPEAPVPVVRKRRSSTAPGGAANAAANIAALGGQVALFGVVGHDEAAFELRRVLEDFGVDASGVETDNARATTVKTRIIAHNQHVVRVDEEDTTPLREPLIKQILANVESRLPLVDAVLISDYAKGLLAVPLVRQVIGLARVANKPVLVDPKGTDYARYLGATIITPNRSELAAATGQRVGNCEDTLLVGQILLEQMGGMAVLVTEGADGMTLLRRDCPAEHFPTCARQVYDVTGAGDTAIAALTLALAAHTELPDAVGLANWAAGLAVEHVGTAAVGYRALAAALENEMRYLVERVERA